MIASMLSPSCLCPFVNAIVGFINPQPHLQPQHNCHCTLPNWAFANSPSHVETPKHRQRIVCTSVSSPHDLRNTCRGPDANTIAALRHAQVQCRPRSQTSSHLPTRHRQQAHIRSHSKMNKHHFTSRPSASRKIRVGTSNKKVITWDPYA